MRPPPPVRVEWRSILWQVLAGVAVLLLVVYLGSNAVTTLARRNIDVDFGFLLRPAGFDIPFRLLPWDTADSYGYALLVALLNTALASVLAIVLASLLGLVLALLRLSKNPLGRALARGFIELVRNTPQLLQIVFWYFAVLQALPQARASLSVFGVGFLNVRGLFLPAPGTVAPDAIAKSLLAALFFVAVTWWLDRRRGRPIGRRWLGGVTIFLLLGYLFAAEWSFPALRGFNFQGGWRLPPELLALVVGIGIYTSAFVAENVRASIGAVHGGQTEAARSLGLSPWRTMRLVILPQAMRTLLPPLTSQYLNIIKSTTLGAAVAYPEVLQVYARTVLNQSGRAVEVMVIVLGVFLAVNLGVSAAMGRWDRRMARQGR